MPGIGSLLVVLTPEEAAKFWPDDTARRWRELSARHEVIDPTAMAPADFAAALRAFAPEVLVSCWATLPLPPPPVAGLRYLCHLTGSVRHLVTRAHLEQGLLVTNWGGTISRIVAECALYHVLACLRRGPHWTQTLRRGGGWREGFADVRSLFERRVGVHGYGSVAREFLRLIAPFDCQMSVCAPDFDEAAAASTGARPTTDLAALFAENDIVVELAPLNASTRGSVTERHLRLLPPGGVFVNVARAAIADEEGLLRVAAENRVRVGLDVFHQEPLPADSPWRQIPEASLTPHIAGPTLDRYVDATAHALRNLRAYAAGEALAAVVTPEAYDLAT
jgi:phosphoglycerate dehydrogenase-like enzyme